MSGGVVDLRRLRSVSPHEMAVRFGFGAAVSVVAGLVTIWHGARAGGALLAFPAILPASLTLLERKEGTEAAVADVRGAIIGAAAMIAFAATVFALVLRIPAVLAVAAGLGAWIATSGLLHAISQGVARALGAERYLPAIPVSDAERTGEALRRRGARVAVAESCTGGVLAALLTEVPGASDFFVGGVISYTDEAKQELLGVPRDLISSRGAVCEPVARAMAEGVRRRLGAEVGIGITGATAGATDGAPPGLIYVAVAGPGALARCVQLDEDDGPDANRSQAVRAALRLCREAAA